MRGGFTPLTKSIRANSRVSKPKSLNCFAIIQEDGTPSRSFFAHDYSTLKPAARSDVLIAP
ncbi:hypothetical protein BSY240_4773 (plasmid) [Agrobacterium sp. RAC06]|nr:hypothetical protein BSY240_4773 [Agrobacterium sp. RAC06]